MISHNDERSLKALQIIVGVGLVLAVAVLCLVCVLVLGREPASTPTWYARHLTQAGIASWYGPRFHGKRTASGEVFDQNKMTAAHRTLRFGTIVVVIMPNGRSVKVRINDRGPFIRRRIIDLSRAAAAELGMQNAGLAQVQIEPLHRVP